MPEKTDREIADGVCKDYFGLNGFIYASRCVISVVHSLIDEHGDRFTLDGCIATLEKVSREALSLRDKLVKAKQS